MPSRRRRVGSCRNEPTVVLIGDDSRDDLVDGDEEVIGDIAFPSSTEASASRRGSDDYRRGGSSENRHVETMDVDIRRDTRRWPPNGENLRATDRMTTAVNRHDQNYRRSSSWIIENPRRRRRRIVGTLETTDEINRNRSPITNEPSSIVTIVNQTAINRTGDPVGEIFGGCDVSSIIGERVDSLTNSTGNICEENETSRTRRRHRDDKIKDFLIEHGDSRRREIRTARSDNSWRTKKNRFFIAVGLLMWCMMIPEIAGRQSHHRTCPGCPHQHVHTINRKAGAESGADAATASENAPTPDDLRLEAIKHQILTKLGLRTRPDVNRTMASVPRHLALETLYRAEAQPVGHQDDRESHREGGRRRDHHRHLDNDDDSTSSSSSSSSYGQFYYAGEEYSYRNVDPGVIGKDDTSAGRDNEESHEPRVDGGGTYEENERHRGHGDFGNDGHGNDAEQNSQVEMDDFYARTSEIITFAEPGRTLNGQPLLEFPRSSGDPALEPLRIKRATLWARVELRHAHHYQHHRRAQSNQRNITLWVFRVRCGNVTHLRGKELGEHLEMVTSLGVNVNQLGWQKFDVTRVVSNWYSGHESSSTRHEKLTLLVDCTGCGSHVHVSTFGVQSPNVVESSLNARSGQDPDRPFLVVRTDPAAVKRVRRRAIECSGAIKGQCCKQRFYVSFSQLGWDDWIIAPQGYYANYCRGDCAAGHRTPDTFLNYYTHVIEEYRKMDRLAGMQPCCAPLKFSPMSLIYYGPDSNIIKRDLPKMVVDECGCP